MGILDFSDGPFMLSLYYREVNRAWSPSFIEQAIHGNILSIYVEN